MPDRIDPLVNTVQVPHFSSAANSARTQTATFKLSEANDSVLPLR